MSKRFSESNSLSRLNNSFGLTVRKVGKALELRTEVLIANQGVFERVTQELYTALLSSLHCIRISFSCKRRKIYRLM